MEKLFLHVYIIMGIIEPGVWFHRISGSQCFRTWTATHSQYHLQLVILGSGSKHEALTSIPCLSIAGFRTWKTCVMLHKSKHKISQHSSPKYTHNVDLQTPLFAPCGSSLYFVTPKTDPRPSCCAASPGAASPQKVGRPTG